MHIVAVRPEPGLTSTIEAAQSLGLSVAGFPLFEVRPLEWNPPEERDLDGLLLGSANAIRFGGQQLERLRNLPVYAVGDATADAARGAGFDVAVTGEGGLQHVLDDLGGQSLRLLRLAGRKHVPLSPPVGIELAARIVYESAALPMPQELAERLQEGGLVLLHSAVAAQHFARECDRLKITRHKIALAALGGRIAAAAGKGWQAARSAEVPRESAMLALARDMCH